MVKLRYLTGRRVPLAFFDNHPAMIFAAEQVWIVWNLITGRDPVFTGGQEDAHSDGSRHFGLYPDPRCRAFDVADDYLNHDQKEEAISELRKRLGNQFDILWELDHLHVEYDPRLVLS